MKTVRAPKINRAAPWLARLALFVLLFQMSAIDHQTNPESVRGVVGSDAHQSHCHGALGSCANGGGELPAVVVQAASLPTSPLLILHARAADVDAPADAELLIDNEPPRI